MKTCFPGNRPAFAVLELTEWETLDWVCSPSNLLLVSLAMNSRLHWEEAVHFQAWWSSLNLGAPSLPGELELATSLPAAVYTRSRPPGGALETP